MNQHFTLKYWMILICLAWLPLMSHAQKAKIRMAQEAYNSFDYATAAEIYSDILFSGKHKDDTTLMRKMADCEIKMGRYAMAEARLTKITNGSNASAQDLIVLADVYKRQGKYAEAMFVYEKLVQTNPNNPIAQGYISDPEFIQRTMRDSTIFTLINAAINSPESDFAPGFFTQSQVIFSSARGEGVGGKRQYNWNQQPYLNVYVAAISGDSSLAAGPTILSSKINSRFHEGTMTYDFRSRMLYITRNNFVHGNLNRSKTGQLNLGIYSSHYNEDGSWSGLENFEYNDEEASTGHPSLNSTATRIYFASNRKGGLGGTDIWYCDKESDGWGEPKNMGAPVNTPADEMFPSIVRDSTLYFTSNGHLGFGGLDMYFYSLYETNAVVRNFGYPANTRYDDFGCAVYPNETVGYFASNRPGGKGDDDIYMFRLHHPDSIVVSGKVVDFISEQPITEAQVSVTNSDGSVSKVITNALGEFTVQVPWQDPLKIDAEKKEYIPNSVTQKLDPRSAFVEGVVIPLKKLDFASQGHVLYAENNLPMEGAKVRVLDETGAVVDSVFTGKDGSYFIPLMDGHKYVIEASKPEYLTLTTEFDTHQDKQKILDYDFKLFKPEKGTVVRLDNIYYDYNKWDIRADAAKELNKLVALLRDNPTMKIELSSHTDSRGSDSYNLSLSEKRAKSAVEYLISQGIAKERLVPKGYGETKVLNRCTNGVQCSDEEHQYNRRTEFKILDI